MKMSKILQKALSYAHKIQQLLIYIKTPCIAQNHAQWYQTSEIPVKLTQFSSLLATIKKSSEISVWSVLLSTSLSFKTL